MIPGNYQDTIFFIACVLLTFPRARLARDNRPVSSRRVGGGSNTYAYLMELSWLDQYINNYEVGNVCSASRLVILSFASRTALHITGTMYSDT